MQLTEPAPAKVNLALHVRGKLPDGRHRIETEQRAFLVETLRAGVVTRLETFAERHESLEAAGLSE